MRPLVPTRRICTFRHVALPCVLELPPEPLVRFRSRRKVTECDECFSEVDGATTRVPLWDRTILVDITAIQPSCFDFVVALPYNFSLVSRRAQLSPTQSLLRTCRFFGANFRDMK